MSFKVQKDLNFDIMLLQKSEVEELLVLATDIIINGYTNVFHPIFELWYKGSGFSESQSLLVYSTVFPQRVLLAVAKWQENYIEFKCLEI